MWKVLLWFAIPIVCFMIDPRIRGANAPLSATDLLMAAWMLWTFYAIVRTAFRWRGRQMAKGWYDEAERRRQAATR